MLIAAFRTEFLLEACTTFFFSSSLASTCRRERTFSGCGIMSFAVLEICSDESLTNIPERTKGRNFSGSFFRSWKQFLAAVMLLIQIHTVMWTVPLRKINSVRCWFSNTSIMPLSQDENARRLLKSSFAIHKTHQLEEGCFSGTQQDVFQYVPQRDQFSSSTSAASVPTARIVAIIAQSSL